MAVHTQFIASVAQPNKKQKLPAKNARSNQWVKTASAGNLFAIAEPIVKALDIKRNPASAKTKWIKPSELFSGCDTQRDAAKYTNANKTLVRAINTTR